LFWYDRDQEYNIVIIFNTCHVEYKYHTTLSQPSSILYSIKISSSYKSI